MLFIQKIISWHEKLFQNPWFTQKVTNLTILISLSFATFACFMNFEARQINWEIWNQNKSDFFVEDTPLFTTMDAGYFLGIAGYLKSGKTMQDYQALRSFPSNKKQNQIQNKSEAAPLLSKIIAFLAEENSPEALLKAGNKMIPYTAVLTVISIFIAFAITGYWLEASVAAAGGGLSLAYYWRSSIGRIDTDQLNLGFMYLIFALIMCAGKSKNFKISLFFTAVAGVFAQVFMSWYGKPELIIMASISLFFLLVVLTKNWRRIFGLTTLFILISGVGFVNPFDSIYLKTGIVSNGFTFSNTISIVTEASSANMMEILTSMTGSILVSIIGIFGLFLWVLRHPTMAIAYSPLAGFFVLNIFIGNRATFYSAPFFWFGGAYLLLLVTRMLILQGFPRFNKVQQALTLIFSSTISFSILCFIWVTSPAYQYVSPSVPAQIIKAMSFLNSKNIQSKDSVVASWWDYGYASMLFNNLPTFTDPGTHGGKNNYFIANALLAKKQSYAGDLLRFLARGGLEEMDIQPRNSLELNEKILFDRNKPAPVVYLILTNQMTAWMPSISKIGKWNIDLGTSIPIEGQKAGQPLSYNFISCENTSNPEVLLCNNTPIELNKGLINGKPVLNSVTETRDGKLFGTKRIRENALNVFQIIKDTQSKSTRVAIMHKELFHSTYHQMFHLGRFDANTFKFIYDGYPYVRIFELLPVS